MSIWKEFKIGDLYNVSSGLSKNADQFGFGTTFISFKDVFGNYFLPDNPDGLVNSTIKDQETCNVLLGDILITRTSESLEEVGMTSVALKDYPHSTFNGFSKRLRLKTNSPIEISPLFIGYLLRTRFFRKSIANFATMTTRASLNGESIKSIPLKFPPIQIQNEIGNTLFSLEKKISLLREENLILEELAKTIFKRWFVDFEFPNEFGNPYKSSGGSMVGSVLGEIPEGWKVGRFEEIIEFINGYAFTSENLLSESSNTTLEVFKMGHIKKGGGFNPLKTKSYFEVNSVKGLDRFILKKGDLLMCMTDMKDNSSLLGHTALMPVSGKYIVNQRVGLIRPKNNCEINFPYLYILTNSNPFLNEIRSRANSGVQVNLSTNGIKETETIFPDIETNKKFQSVVKELFEKMFANQFEQQLLIEFRDTLIPKLMSGELNIKID